MKNKFTSTISKDNDNLKDLLEGRTERLSFPVIQSDNTDKLTEKPLDKYSDIKKIGSGGMKNIKCVKDSDTARDIAMAVLKEQPEDDGILKSRFIYEARITANLEHPNIVPIHDIGLDKNGKPYFTMKLIEGETLAHILTKIGKGDPEYIEKYKLQNLLRIFIKICNAIDFAHAKGVIHLDLKPENVQIGNFGEVLVLDWGLARITSEVSKSESLNSTTDRQLKELSENSDYDRTLDGEIKGSPGFMAPEQAAGNNSARGTTTDVYSLGTILYAILTLRKPIKGKNIKDILNDTITGKIIPIHERNPGREIPKPLAAVAMKAMALEQKNRYPNVKELINDVDAFLGGYVTKAEQAGFVRHIELLIKRNKITSTFIFLFLVAVIIALGMLLTYNTKRSSFWGAGVNISPLSQDQFEKEWKIIDGNWEFNDGQIIAKEGKGNSYIIFFNHKIYGNIAIEFDAEIPSGKDLEKSGDLSVIIAASKDRPTKSGYYLQTGGIGNTSAIIQKKGEFMTAVDFSLEAGKKYHIRAEKEGAELRLFCDGKKLITSRDIFYLEGGYIGLYTFGKGKFFSNIVIYRKGVPELVSPTIEGDAFYRESRAVKNKESKINFLKLANKAYSKVYKSHPNSNLGAEALLKRAYISTELGEKENIISAINDTIRLKELAPSLDLMLLEGRLYFIENNFSKAFSTYFKAIEKHPESASAITSILSGHLKPNLSKKICPQLRQNFWKLCALYNSSPVFRCQSRNLDSLKFLNGLNFTLIDCSNNNIESLAPLAKMKLKNLDCAGNKISTLAPLKDLNLESLECHDNKNLVDISAISGMKLKTLSLNGCINLKNINPIKNCLLLERLTVPEHLAQTDFLKNMPNLKYLNTKWDSWTMTKEEFFNQYHK